AGEKGVPSRCQRVRLFRQARPALFACAKSTDMVLDSPVERLLFARVEKGSQHVLDRSTAPVLWRAKRAVVSISIFAVRQQSLLPQRSTRTKLLSSHHYRST